MKNLIDKYQEQILDLGVGYFDLSGQVNNDRIILNLYKSEFKNGLSAGIVLKLGEPTNSTFGFCGHDLNLKRMLYYKLITCDGDEYDFLNSERFNEELGLKLINEEGHRKIVSENSLIEEYYDRLYENYYYLTNIVNKSNNEEITFNYVEDRISSITNNEKHIDDEGNEIDLKERFEYTYNENNVVSSILIYKGTKLLKEIYFDYNYYDLCRITINKDGKLEKKYEINKDGFVLTFKDCLTNLSKTFDVDDRNNFTGNITDEYGVITNIENGAITPYYNKFTSETDREKIRFKYHFDSNNRVCDIEGYNKMHSIRKYQGNKLLLRCDGCFKDIRYLGNVVPYYNYILTGTIDKIVTDNNVNFINGLGNDSLYQIDLRSTSMIELEYKNCYKKSYSGVFITDDLHYSNLKISISYRLMDGSSKVEEYSINNNIFAVPIVLPNNCEEFVLSLLGEQNPNNEITFNLFVIDKCICNSYKYNKHGKLIKKIENGVLTNFDDVSDEHNYLINGNIVSIGENGKLQNIYKSNLTKITNQYDDYNLLIKTVQTHNDSVISEEESFYDNQNRLIKKTTSLNNTPSIYEYNDYTVSKVRTGQDEVEYVNSESKPLLSKINYRKVSENNSTLLKSHGFHYGNDYLLAGLTENNTNKYLFIYDQYKRLIRVKLQGQIIEEYAYNDTFPHLLSAKLVNGVQEIYQYDTFENLIGLQRGNNQFTFTYNEDNLITTITLNNQVIATYEYEYGKLISSTKNRVTERYIYNEEDKIVESVVAVNNTSSSVRYENTSYINDSLSKMLSNYLDKNENVYGTMFINKEIEVDYNLINASANLLNKNNERIFCDYDNEVLDNLHTENGISYIKFNNTMDSINYDIYTQVRTFSISTFVRTNGFNKEILFINAGNLYELYVDNEGVLQLYKDRNTIWNLPVKINPNKFELITFSCNNGEIKVYYNTHLVGNIDDRDDIGFTNLEVFSIRDTNQDECADFSLTLFKQDAVFTDDDMKWMYIRYLNLINMDKIESNNDEYLNSETITTIEENITLDEITFSNTNISRNGLKPVTEYREVFNNKDCAYEYDKDLKCVCLNKMGLVYDLGIKENGTISFNLKTDTNDSTILIVKEKQDTLFKLYKENNKLYAETKGWSPHEISLDTSNYHNCVIQINTNIVDFETNEIRFNIYVDGALKCMQGFEEENTYLTDNLLFRFNMDESYNIGSNKISSLKFSNNILTSSQINKEKLKVVNRYSTTGLLQEKSFLKNNNYEFVKEYRYNSKFQVYLEQSPVGDYQYGYDDKNNLTYHTGTQYQYDDRNRLVKEIKDNQTIEYRYDVRDNVTHIIKNGSSVYSYSYDTKDRLVMTNGVNVTYSNSTSLYPTHIDTRVFALDLTWQDNRLYVCSRTQNNSQVGLLRFTYDYKGLRKTKFNIQRGITHTYTYDEQDRLIVERRSDNKTLRYYYDTNNMLCSFSLNGVMYFYERDAFGNINHLIDKNGNVVVSYSCKAYGQDMSYVDNTSFGLGDINPFRYKGYYYDVETQLFYCNSRYYSPELFRWISPDSIDYLDPESINGLNLYCYCMNNPIMYADPSGHMPEWLQWTLGGLIVVGAIALSICTAGLATPIATAVGGGLFGAIVGGAVAGAIGGAIAGFGVSIGTQAITNGFKNINWSDVGKSTASGAISGFIAGGVFGGIKYAYSAKSLANSVSGLSKAQSSLDNAWKPLSNVKNLANMPFSGANIARTVGQAAANYNAAYTNLIFAGVNNTIANLAFAGMYAGAQFGLKQLIGYGINQIW